MGRKGFSQNAPATIKLEDGTATYMGDGMFVIDQVDSSRRGDARFTRSTLSRQEMLDMLAMAA
jgi:hypothetical protein